MYKDYHGTAHQTDGAVTVQMNVAGGGTPIHLTNRGHAGVAELLYGLAPGVSGKSFEISTARGYYRNSDDKMTPCAGTTTATVISDYDDKWAVAKEVLEATRPKTKKREDLILSILRYVNENMAVLMVEGDKSPNNGYSNQSKMGTAMPQLIKISRTL
jgi:hypothetical protein